MLVNQPLLLQACLDGKFGTIFEQSRKLNIKLSRGGLCSGNKQGGG